MANRSSIRTVRLIVPLLFLIAWSPLHAHRILTTADQHWVSGILGGSSTPPPATDSHLVDSGMSSGLTFYGAQYVGADSYYQGPSEHNRSSAGSFWEDAFSIAGPSGPTTVRMLTTVSGISHGSGTGSAELSFHAALLTPSLTQHFPGISISAPNALTSEEFLETTVAVFDVVVGELWTIQAELGVYAKKGASIDASGFALTWFELLPGYSLASSSATDYRVVSLAEPDYALLLSLVALVLASVARQRRDGPRAAGK